MSEALVPLVPVVSWPRVLQPGQRYLVTVDIRLDTDAPPWPYDREEFAIGCMLEGGSGMTVEALGATTVGLHRFGGTYGPARFLTQLEAPTPQDTPQLTLTLITEGGVPFHTVPLPVRHAAQTDAPGLILDLLDDSPTPYWGCPQQLVMDRLQLSRMSDCIVYTSGCGATSSRFPRHLRNAEWHG